LADDCIVVYEPIEFPFFKERTPTDSEERTVRMDGLVGSLLWPCSAYPIFGLFGLFFQPEQYFSLTAIQLKQCFSVKFQTSERGQDIPKK